jgi:hypothetical protein
LALAVQVQLELMLKAELVAVQSFQVSHHQAVVVVEVETQDLEILVRQVGQAAVLAQGRQQVQMQVALPAHRVKVTQVVQRFLVWGRLVVQVVVAQVR